MFTERLPFFLFVFLLFSAVFALPADVNGNLKLTRAAENDAVPPYIESVEVNMYNYFPSQVQLPEAMEESLDRTPSIKVKRHLPVEEANFNPYDEEFDMEVAEVNVFRPVFRYRVALAKQVKSRTRQRF